MVESHSTARQDTIVVYTEERIYVLAIRLLLTRDIPSSHLSYISHIYYHVIPTNKLVTQRIALVYEVAAHT